MKFEELGLGPKTLLAIAELGFENPTPVQEKTIPVLLEKNQDFVVLAQTGTGKTAAFGLPVVEKIDYSNKNVQALVLAPTRELCVQVANDIKQYSKFIDELSIVPIYGGAGIEPQIRALKRGAQVVVGTPGRTLDLIRRNVLDISNIHFLVLDEADEMLKMGFKEDMDAILSTTPKEKQSLLFSATMPSEIEQIARTYMNNPKEISAGERNTGTENVEHWYYVVENKDRYMALKRIADMNPDIYGIIFCRTKKDTQEIADQLIQDNYNAESIHGDLSQAQRDNVMKRFRKGLVQLLVATDVAARGIDVDDLTHVINYMLPDQQEVYIHRSGRTGRAGRKGICISILKPQEEKQIRFLEKKVGREFQRKLIPSGEEIVTKKVFHFIDRLEKLEPDGEMLAPYMEAISNKLGHLSKEDIVARLITIEAARFLTYYEGANDINVKASGEKGKKGRGMKYTRYFINLGSRDRMTPSGLIEIINRVNNLRGMEVGKIEIMRNFTFFDGDSSYADILPESMKDLEFNGIPFFVEVAKEPAVSTERPGGRKAGHGGGFHKGKNDKKKKKKLEWATKKKRK